MVKSAEQRKRKYEGKIDADVLKTQTTALKPSMVKHQSLYMSVVTDLEAKIKKLVEAEGVTTLEVRDYLNYGRELLDLSRRFSKTTLQIEAQTRADKWSARGLDGILLTDVANLLGIDITAEPLILSHFDLMFRRVGQFYYSPFLTSQLLSTVHTVLQNSLYAVPFYIPRRVRFDKIGMAFSTFSGSPLIGFSVYKSNSSLYPTEKITDLGVLTVDAPALKSINIDLTLTRGFCWFTFIKTNSASCNIRYTPYFPQILGTPEATYYPYVEWEKINQSYPPSDPYPSTATPILQLHTLCLRVAELL